MRAKRGKGRRPIGKIAASRRSSELTRKGPDIMRTMLNIDQTIAERPPALMRYHGIS